MRYLHHAKATCRSISLLHPLMSVLMHPDPSTKISSIALGTNEVGVSASSAWCPLSVLQEILRACNTTGCSWTLGHPLKLEYR
jgi:hypothetical protein